MGFLIDPIPNSPNLHDENHLADSKENFDFPAPENMVIPSKYKWANKKNKTKKYAVRSFNNKAFSLSLPTFMFGCFTSSWKLKGMS